MNEKHAYLHTCSLLIVRIEDWVFFSSPLFEFINLNMLSVLSPDVIGRVLSVDVRGRELTQAAWAAAQNARIVWMEAPRVEVIDVNAGTEILMVASHGIPTLIPARDSFKIKMALLPSWQDFQLETCEWFLIEDIEMLQEWGAEWVRNELTRECVVFRACNELYFALTELLEHLRMIRRMKVRVNRSIGFQRREWD